VEEIALLPSTLVGGTWLALKRRFEWKARRQGVHTGPSRRDEGELDRLLGEPRK
jgi:hypothetical protein